MIESQKIIPIKDFFYIVDFFLPDFNLVFEIDGTHHQDDPKQVSYDQTRDDHLLNVGIKTIRILNEETKDHRTLTNKLVTILATHRQFGQHKTFKQKPRVSNRTKLTRPIRKLKKIIQTLINTKHPELLQWACTNQMGYQFRKAFKNGKTKFYCDFFIPYVKLAINTKKLTDKQITSLGKQGIRNVTINPNELINQDIVSQKLSTYIQNKQMKKPDKFGLSGSLLRHDRLEVNGLVWVNLAPRNQSPGPHNQLNYKWLSLLGV